MSKIGKKIIIIPNQVTVSVADNQLITKGPKGELKLSLLPNIKVKIEGNEISLSRNNDEKQTKANHGLMRSLIANNIEGVTNAYKKTLKLVGTGYRVSAKGTGLSMTLGFSHLTEVQPVEGVTFKVEGNDTIHVEGIDKQLVGQVAADIRSLRPPEPYLGKGIRYIDEVVKKKPGKTASK
ncbi:MAG TPA: 50S ribosomal protein L6 [Candidatus Woesebacteria bacterium]|nr:50S ribosomal protein L6 [Candidatus Woesebacteria bacterium]